jgi:hypothetical protein
MRAVQLRLLSSAWLLAYCASSCVPADTRPVPATIDLEISPNDASQEGIATTDGWMLTIDRFFVGIGDADVGDTCLKYSEGGYGRLIDARRSDDQKLALLFGFGQCGLRVRVAGPASDTILGEGVTEEDALLLGLKGTDPYVTQESSASVGIAATATRGSTTERFNWSFRQRITYRDCETPVDGKPGTPLDFPSNANFTYHIVLHPETLLRDDHDGATAALRFDAMMSADTIFGNADGEVTLSELGGVTLDEARKTGPYSIGDSTDPNAASKIHTLEDYVYLVLLPAIPQFREGFLCTPNVHQMYD